MIMYDADILRDYKEAKDRIAQVEILADLNTTDVWTMATWLKSHGADINLQKFAKHNPKIKGFAKNAPEETEAKPELTEAAYAMRLIRQIVGCFDEKPDLYDPRTIIMTIGLIVKGEAA